MFLQAWFDSAEPLSNRPPVPSVTRTLITLRDSSAKTPSCPSLITVAFSNAEASISDRKLEQESLFTNSSDTNRPRARKKLAERSSPIESFCNAQASECKRLS